MRLLLFDVDGTLCRSGQKIESNMQQTLTKLSQLKDTTLAIIGGGIYDRISSQLKESLGYFKFVCSENGLMSYQLYEYEGEIIHNKIHNNNLRYQWKPQELTAIINDLLKITLEINDLPVKTGKFILVRNGLIYWCPMGGGCTQRERDQFKAIDQAQNYRINLIKRLRDKSKHPRFSEDRVELGLGGELGIAVSPKGWDKSYIKNVLDLDKYDEIYFFGDKLGKYGSDEPILKLTQIKSIAVTDPDDCIIKINQIFDLN